MRIHDSMGRIKMAFSSFAGYVRGLRRGQGEGAKKATGSERRKSVQLALYIVILVLVNIAAMTLKLRCD
ncbi:MAG: hypothetical protein E4G96_06025, partial [Chrysiogenales bacterium]